MTRATAILLAVLALLLPTAGAAVQDTSADGWRAFTGSWTARGVRHEIPTEGGRTAAIVRLSGAVVVSKEAGLGGGMLGVAIAFDDGQTLSAGRAVWTDTRGDQVFSELKGEPVATGRRIAGTITGGTGRYAGVSGEYELTWQYTSRDVDGEVQGRAVDLHGRVRGGTQ